MEEKIREAIKNILKTNKEIIIYPFGFWGKRTKVILNEEFDIQEFCVVDNNYSDEGVKNIEEIEINEINNYCWLIACIDDTSFTDIMKSLDEHNVDEQNIEDVFWNYHYYHLHAPKFMIYDAQRQGLTLAQYYENHYNSLGVKSETVIDNIVTIIELPEGGNICEIGTGSGRFLIKLIERFRPAKYEFYEIEKILSEYIVNTYKYNYCKIINNEADGKSLQRTLTESQDMVFASNVFSLIKYSTTYQYFLEMIRVCKKGGYVIFDAHTEDTLQESVLNNDDNVANDWRILPQITIENIFEKRKMKLVRKFESLMAGGDRKTQIYHVVETWYIYKKEEV